MGTITKKKSFFKTFIITFLILCVVFTGAIYGLSNLRLFGGTENLLNDMDPIAGSSEFADEFANSKRVNVLLLGVNQNLTDTLMLGSYDMEAQHVDVISIPRDTYYPRNESDGAAYQKINAIYAQETAVGTAEAVSDVLMGIPIHYYAVIEYDGLEEIVDSLGGVPVNIPFDMDYEDPYDKPPLRIHLKAGEQTLNGEDAVKYLRYRKGYSEGDVGRVKAQQEFVKSAFNQALSFRLPNVVKTVIQNVDSDIPLGMATKIATNAVGLEGSDMVTYITPGEAGTEDGASFWFVDEKGIEDMIREIYSIAPEEE